MSYLQWYYKTRMTPDEIVNPFFTESVETSGLQINLGSTMEDEYYFHEIEIYGDFDKLEHFVTEVLGLSESETKAFSPFSRIHE